MPLPPFTLPQRLADLRGWRRNGLLMLLGALATLALPPIGFLPILLISITGLIWAWDRTTSYQSAFWTVWFWCLGFYAAGFYWIAYALLIDAWHFGWMVPFATFGLGGVVALFPALGLTAAFGLRGSNGPVRIVWVAVFWTIGEWLRTFVLTGFAWNPLGSVWDGMLPVLQAGALFGVHGLSFMTMLCFGLLALIPLTPLRKRRIILAIVAVSLPLSLGIWGQIRLLTHPTEFVSDSKLRVVQPNVMQGSRPSLEKREELLQNLLTLSRKDGFDGLTAVIWPESAVPFDLIGDNVHRKMAAMAVPDHGILLAGGPRFQPLPNGKWQFWNSLIALDQQAAVVGLYDKAHLVPFGEYVPLRKVLPLPAVAAELGDFSAGPGPRTLTVPGLPPFGVAICYESIFPGEVVQSGPEHPNLLVIITNDGWFGISTGPYQHFAAGRMRAIEEGIPVARAANTGVSGIVDAYGRVLAESELGVSGIVDAKLPEADPKLTIYARWGNWIIFLLLGLSVLFAVKFNRYS